MINGKNLVVADNTVVRIEYSLALNDGDVIDSSAEDGPLEFLQGANEIIPGLEAAIYGMSVGEQKNIVVTPDLAYGEYDPEDYQLVPRDAFEDDAELEPGMAIEFVDEESGEAVEGFISEIQQDGVVIDFNHWLAGETLYFDVKVVGVRPALPDEIEHGHAHDDEHPH
ncbi:peptidylprolyl isomerase [Caldilinea sp.]|uniref:FKBP-type peptidyl-prolyl cis-trans isomerase n=1 Tax=Caldilinea sp. TaxID=2293560 RepID=UPI002B9D74BE|nr:peptidylprolyl isomerase [Caldilinea sp.]